MRVEAKHLGTESDRGITVLRTALAKCTTPELLIALLGRYVQFNAVFGSGVAALAGAVGSRLELFRVNADSKTFPGHQDISVSIAAQIFFAAIDEFGDGGRKINHRQLAKQFLSGAAKLFNQEHSVCGDFPYIDQVRFGYGVDRKLDDRGLFRALGFHIGSEYLADMEFREIDAFLRQNYPDITELLPDNAYQWISLHGGEHGSTGVEDEHAAAAVKAANLALTFYKGELGNSDRTEAVEQGFMDFVNLQAEFMATL